MSELRRARAYFVPGDTFIAGRVRTHGVSPVRTIMRLIEEISYSIYSKIRYVSYFASDYRASPPGRRNICTLMEFRALDFFEESHTRVISTGERD